MSAAVATGDPDMDALISAPPTSTAPHVTGDNDMDTLIQGGSTAPRSGFLHTLAGEAQLGGTLIGNIIPNALNSANDLANRIYRTPGAVNNPVPTFKVGQA